MHHYSCQAQDQLAGQGIQTSNKQKNSGRKLKCPPGQVSADKQSSVDSVVDSLMGDSTIIDEDGGFSTMEESSVLNCSFNSPMYNENGRLSILRVF